MRDADARRDPVRDDARRHPRPGRDRAGPGRRRPERASTSSGSCPARATTALAAPLGIGRRAGHRLHLELHRATRASATSSRPPPLLRRRGRRVRLPARRRRRGAGRRSRPSRPTAGLDDGTVIFTGRVPHDDVAALLPADRRLRRPAHERPGLAAGDAAQAVRGDGDGAGRSSSATSAPCSRSSRDGRDRPLVPARGPGQPGRRRRAARSTTRPSASRLGTAARRWVTANRTWDQNGARYRGAVRTPGRGLTDEAPPSPRRRIAYLTYSTGQYDSRTQRMARVGRRAGLRRDRLCALGARPAARGRGSRLSHRPRPSDCRAGVPGLRAGTAAVAATIRAGRSGRPGTAASSSAAGPSRERRGCPRPRRQRGRTEPAADRRHRLGRSAARGRCAGRAFAWSAPAEPRTADPADSGAGGSSCSRSGRMGWATALAQVAEPADIWHGMWAASLPALARLRGSTAAGRSTTAATSSCTPASLRGWARGRSAARRASSDAGRGGPTRSSPSTMPTPGSWPASSCTSRVPPIVMNTPER